MQTVNLVQGSAEWHAHRAKYLNASDAPAMMGESKYSTRDQLLDQYATGYTPEVDAGTQKIFNDGHAFEALARPIAEKIIGDDLSPTVGYEGDYGASFDGITFIGDVIFEHKTLNDDLRAVFADIQTRAPEYRDNSGDLLPMMYRIQMEHQLMVSGAEKCLFMASKWGKDGSLIEEHHTWYLPDLDLRQKIVAGWVQFKKDLETYVPPVRVEKVQAETIEALPVPSVVVRGEITQSNLLEITPKFDAYLGSIKTELSTDQDFADAEANAKNCEDTEKRIEALRENIIAQMVSVNEVDSVLGNYQEAFRKMKVLLKNAVKEQKDNIKKAAIIKAKTQYADFISELQKGCVVMLHSELSVPDFDTAIKGVKTIETMQSRINNALAQGKAEATTLANDVKTKVAFISEAIKGYEHLINVPSLALRDLDYIKLHIQSVKEQEDKRKAEHEARIKAQAEEVARAKVLAEQAEQRKQELQAKESATASQSKPLEAPVSTESKTTLPPQMEAEFGKVFIDAAEGPDKSVALNKARPTDDQIIDALTLVFHVHESKIVEWLLEMDLEAASLKLAA